MKINTLLALALLFALSGCASIVPVSSSLNDFVSMVKTSNHEIVLSYTSLVSDGNFLPCSQNKVSTNTMHPEYEITPTVTLESMVKEYMDNKFSNIREDARSVLCVKLKDFWLEEYSVDTTGRQVLTALAGGDSTIHCAAKIKVEIDLILDGKEYIKNISASAEDNYVNHVAVGLLANNYSFRVSDPIQTMHAKNVNSAFNKVILVLNSFLDEQLETAVK